MTSKLRDYLMLFVFLFASLSCAASLEKKLRSNEKLIWAIADFCTSSDGYESEFCADYAKLRRERAASTANSTETVTTPAEKTNKTTTAGSPSGTLAKPDEILLIEGSKTTVISLKDAEPSKNEVAELKKTGNVTATSTVTTTTDLMNKTTTSKESPSRVETPEVIALNETNKTAKIDSSNTTESEQVVPELSQTQIQEELRKIIQEEIAKKNIQKSTPDDPACSTLRDEYDDVCFATPPLAAFQETREFCVAFVKNCQGSLVTNIFTNIKNFKVDFSLYCRKHRERFRYVCPDPLRFQSFAENAVDFCVRYHERCPDEETPTAPVQFRRKDEGHIYTREIEFWCTRTKRTVYNYCTEPELLKVYKYQLFCGLYKHVCIDVYKRVIYG